MTMDAWRDGHDFYVKFDLPGVDPDSIDLTGEQNVLSVKAERAREVKDGMEMLASERPAATFTCVSPP
jgi:HSP20 family protein